jgi:addiction module HigA family antidote
MKEYTVQRPLRRPPIHPGEIVRADVLPALGLSVSEAARRLGVSRQQLHRILACTHPITTEMALRIGKLAGNGPGLWLRLQQAHDLWHAEQRLKEELARIVRAAPVSSGAELGAAADVEKAGRG